MYLLIFWVCLCYFDRAVQWWQKHANTVELGAWGGMRDAQTPTIKTLCTGHCGSGCTSLVWPSVSFTRILQLRVGSMYKLARASTEDAVNVPPRSPVLLLGCSPWLLVSALRAGTCLSWLGLSLLRYPGSYTPPCCLGETSGQWPTDIGVQNATHLASGPNKLWCCLHPRASRKGSGWARSSPEVTGQLTFSPAPAHMSRFLPGCPQCHSLSNSPGQEALSLAPLGNSPCVAISFSFSSVW